MSIQFGSLKMQYGEPSMNSKVSHRLWSSILAVVFLVSACIECFVRYLSVGTPYASHAVGNSPHRPQIFADAYLICIFLFALAAVILVYRARTRKEEDNDHSPVLVFVSSAMLVFAGMVVEILCVYLIQCWRIGRAPHF